MWSVVIIGPKIFGLWCFRAWNIWSVVAFSIILLISQWSATQGAWYILTGLAGVARPATTAVAPTSPPLYFNTKFSVVRRDARLPQMIACRCRCQSSSSSDGGLTLLLATGPVEPGLCARLSALRSASNGEKEASAEREARNTRRGLAP